MIRRLLSVLAVRGGEAVVRYGFNLALAVSLGAHGAGQFYVGISIISLAASLARFGVDVVAVKKVSVAVAAEDWPAARGVTAFALGSTAVLGGGLSLLLLFLGPWLAPELGGLLRVFAFGAMALALQSAAGSLLAAVDRAVVGQVVSVIAWPLLTMLVLLAARPGAVATGLVAVLAMGMAAGCGGVLLWRSLGSRRSPLTLPSPRGLLAAAWPFFGVEMVYLLLQNLPVLSLGLLVSDREAGLFGLASRVSMLVTVLMVGMYAVAAPRFARLHAAGDVAGLRRAAHQASRGILVPGLPVALLLLAFPAEILGLFGQDFRAAAPILAIAMAGQVVNVVFSQSYTLLVMTGHERWLWHVALTSLGTMLAALALFLPLLGAVGAAIAMALAGVVMSLGQALGVRRRLGLSILEAYVPLGLWRATARPAR